MLKLLYFLAFLIKAVFYGRGARMATPFRSPPTIQIVLTFYPFEVVLRKMFSNDPFTPHHLISNIRPRPSRRLTITMTSHHNDSSFRRLTITTTHHFDDSPSRRLTITTTSHFDDLPSRRLTISTIYHHDESPFRRLTITTNHHFDDLPLRKRGCASVST